MRKFIFVLITALTMAVSVKAQMFIGGSVGVVSFGGDGQDDKTAFRILPEVGYHFNENWTLGTVIGYEKGSLSLLGQSEMSGRDAKGFSFSPYLRWSFAHLKFINVFMDLTAGFTTGSIDKNDFTAWNAGLKPGIAIDLNEHFSFETKVGFLGYEAFNPNGKNNDTHDFGLNVSGSNLEFGVTYNF